MKDNNDIKGNIKRKKKEQDINRIKDCILGIGEKRMAAELIGIP